MRFKEVILLISLYSSCVSYAQKNNSLRSGCVVNSNSLYFLVCLQNLTSQLQEDVDEFYCNGLTDEDLPLLDSFSGEGVYFFSCTFTHLDSSSFPNLRANSIIFESCNNLATIESGFWSGFGREKLVSGISFYKCGALKKFPFFDIQGFDSLQGLSFYRTNIEDIPGGLVWPTNFESFNMVENFASIHIFPYTFFNAPSLFSLNIDLRGGSNGQTVVEKNGLALSSKQCDLTFVSLPLAHFAPHAFEYGSADSLVISLDEFPERTFRYILKRKFDEGKQSFISFYNGAPYGGPIRLPSCGCEIAWLYKDAKKYGLETYQSLIGEYNVMCPGVGPILETTDPNFIQEMENCPETPIPYPEPNNCEGVNDIFVADPWNCQCFFSCRSEITTDHICCQRPLVFNPDLLTCDSSMNVPNC